MTDGERSPVRQLKWNASVKGICTVDVSHQGLDLINPRRDVRLISLLPVG